MLRSGGFAARWGGCTSEKATPLLRNFRLSSAWRDYDVAMRLATRYKRVCKALFAAQLLLRRLDRLAHLERLLRDRWHEIMTTSPCGRHLKAV